ncbi:MAG: lipoprotein [Bacilli bacterium]|nr:lipoprotein [Bacilli bacterium]
MKKYIILILSIFLLSGCSLYDEYKMPKNVSIKTYKRTYEVYSNKKIKNLIKEKNVEILNQDQKLDTKKIGKHTVTIEYKHKIWKHKLDVTYNVVDTLPPTLITAKLDYVSNVNEEIDFCSNTKFIDNYDRKPICSIEGEYDLSKDGNYNLTYIFKDSSDNTTVQSFNLTVIDPDNETNYYDNDDEDDGYFEEEIEDIQEGIQFSDVVKAHKKENTMIGIDISRWQGDVDFHKVKKAGAEFVIMRMAVSNGPKDKIGLDSYYKKNIKKAKKAGLKVGVYVYTSASSSKEVQKQAEFVRKELKKEKLDFPIVYDFESWDEIQEYKLNKYDLMNYVNIFNNEVKKDGYEVMLYGSKLYLEKAWDNKKYPVWLAHYVPNYFDTSSYEGNYDMWQICSDGIIDGINGYVDINIYYKK